MPRSDDSFDWIDRTRGILTKNERKHILGELDEELDEDDVDSEKIAERIRIREHRLRDHIANSLIDFVILTIPGVAPVEAVFDEVWEGWSVNEDTDSELPDTPLVDGLVSIIDLLYRQLGSVYEGERGPFKSIFLEGVTIALRNLYLEDRDLMSEPSVDLGIHPGPLVPIEKLKTALEEEESLAPIELITLHRADELSDEEYETKQREYSDLSREDRQEIAQHRRRERERLAINSEFFEKARDDVAEDFDIDAD